jgi:simple sugar transport system ATP-binding protein
VTSSASGDAALEVRELSKSFGPVQALRSVSLGVRRGEVLGLLGDNGAGKSTLVKCLSGLYRPDSGSVLVHGEPVEIHSADDARRTGIETVHQNLALVAELDVAANMFLNRELTVSIPLARRLGWLDKREMYTRTREILDRLHVHIPSVRQQVAKLSGGQRQAVAVSRAVEWSNDIVLLDEPTAAVGVEQASVILDLIRNLATEGIAVLLISHNMQHVVDVCDRAVVLRHGTKVGDVSIPDVTPTDLVDLITGAVRSADHPNSKPDKNGDDL